jgi:hypothetical protein
MKLCTALAFMLLAAGAMPACGVVSPRADIALEELEPSRAEGILRAKVAYDEAPKYLVLKEGVRLYKDMTLGKWGWTGMPVAAVMDGKVYLATLENIGNFFQTIKTGDQAYELVTFLPSYWTFSRKSVKRAKDGWIVRVNAVGMNETQKTVLTYKVLPDGGCKLTGNSNPKADPTQGIIF